MSARARRSGSTSFDSELRRIRDEGSPARRHVCARSRLDVERVLVDPRGGRSACRSRIAPSSSSGTALPGSWDWSAPASTRSRGGSRASSSPRPSDSSDRAMASGERLERIEPTLRARRRLLGDVRERAMPRRVLRWSPSAARGRAASRESTRACGRLRRSGSATRALPRPRRRAALEHEARGDRRCGSRYRARARARDAPATQAVCVSTRGSPAGMISQV